MDAQVGVKDQDSSFLVFAKLPWSAVFHNVVSRTWWGTTSGQFTAEDPSCRSRIGSCH